MFRQGQDTIGDYYAGARNAIVSQIEQLSFNKLEGTSIEEWVEYLFQEYALSPIIIKSEAPTIREKEEQEYGTRGVPELEVVNIDIPIEQNIKGEIILEHRASTWNLFLSPMTYIGNYISFESSSTNPNQVKTKISEQLTNVRNINSDIEQENLTLKQYIASLINERKSKLNAKKASIKNLAEALGANLKLTENAEILIHARPEIKQGIRNIREPLPQPKPTIYMDRKYFEPILSIIDMQSSAFERTVATINKLEEEDLRNLLIATLNGAFNQTATGETFSKLGKVDITLKIPQGGVFIVETKFWSGPKTIDESTEQILKYLTWRDAYGVVILFSRIKNFSLIFPQIIPTIQRSESLSGNIITIDQHHYVARHSLPEDINTIVEIHYLIYNVCI